MHRRLFFASLLTIVPALIAAQTVTHYEHWLGNDATQRTTVNSDATNINFAVPTSQLAEGLQTLNFRVQNSEGEWSPIQRMLFFVPAEADTKAALSDYEWWLDDNITTWQSGTNDATTKTFAAKTDNLEVGLHTVNFRQRNTNGDWSPIQRMLFYIPDDAEPAATISGIEYWLDDDYAHRTSKVATKADYALQLDVAGLDVGLHTFNFRTRNTSGDWSPLSRFLFYIPDEPDETNSPYIGYCYSFNAEQTNINISETTHYELKNYAIPIPALTKIGNMEQGCTFSFDLTNYDVTLSRTQAVDFALWFRKKDGTTTARARTSFSLTDDLTRHLQPISIGQSADFGALQSGDFCAIRFDAAGGLPITVETSLPCKLRLYDTQGRQLRELTFNQTCQLSLASGTYFAILSHPTIGGGNTTTPFKVQLTATDDTDKLQEYLNSLTDTRDLFASGWYERNFLNTEWQALYIPCAIAYESWSDNFEVASPKAFVSYDDDGDGQADRHELVAAYVESGSLSAYTPYFIRAKRAGYATFEVCTPMSEQTQNGLFMSSQYARCSVNGTLVERTGLHTSGQYRLMGGWLAIPDSDDEVLQPYRWYMSITGRNAQTTAANIQVRFVDIRTAIDIIDCHNSEQINSETTYDLAGRRIATDRGPTPGMRKGIYIVGNKKRVIK